MSIKTYKWIAGGLLCVALVLGWRYFILYRQVVSAALISFQCETIEKAANNALSPEVLAHDVKFLTAYYGEHSKALVGSPIYGVVQRNFHHALTNSLVAFRRISTNDLGDDLGAWIQKYGNH